MIKRIIIVIISIIVVMLGRGFFYYSGFYTPPPTEIPNYEKFLIPLAPTSEFSDESSENISEEERTVLIDSAHENNFIQEELNVLMLRIISRGLDIRFFKAEDELEEELLGREAEEKEIVEEEEPPEGEVEEETVHEEEPSGPEDEAEVEPEEQLEEEVDGGQVKLEDSEEEKEEEKIPPEAFIIVSPQTEFSKEETKIVKEFVDEGGKLLLIDDPTRMGKINSISIDFGLIFEPDYLYNLKENEINYRNIFISEFEDNEITENLKKIVLYVAGSISSPDGGIAFADQNTSSSLIESRKELSPIALNEEAKVLAIHDLTFLTEPYNGAFDNNQLIANIADWLSVPIGEEKGEEEKESAGQ